MTLDKDTLNDFVGRFVGDLGATVAAGGVVRRRPARALSGAGRGPGDARPSSPPAPAPTPGTSTEWLRGQAAGGYVDVRRRRRRRYSLTEEQAFALTDPDGPVYLPGAFELALGALHAEPRIDRGVPDRRRLRLARARRRTSSSAASSSSGPGYAANLVPSWIPALDGVEDKLRAGAHGRRRRLRPRRVDACCWRRRTRAADVRRLRLPRGLDRGGPQARRRGRRGRPGRASRSRPRRPSPGTGYDLVATFDCLHDMGDPLSARPGTSASALAAGRHLADRRAVRRRHGRRQPQPGRPGLLQLLDLPLRAQRPVPARRLRPRRPGRRGGDPPGGDRRRVHPVPPGAETPFNLVYEARP